MSFEVSFVQIAPQWLLGTVGTALLQTWGQKLDTQLQKLKDGIKARFPSTAPTDALPFIGRDRGLEQGPLEPAANFAARLELAAKSAQTQGNAESIIRQLVAFFDGIGQPAIRLVTDRGVWHEYDWTTDTVTKSRGRRGSGSWNWDGTVQPWRGWVIIDASSIGWVPWVSGSGVPFDGSFVMGSTTPPAYVEQIQRLVQRWKTERMYVPRIIVTFVANIFTNPPDVARPLQGPMTSPKQFMFLLTPENPNGQYGNEECFNPNATFWLSGGEEP